MSKRVREWFFEYKKTLKCVACGEDDPCCLSFHHIDPGSKKASIWKLVNSAKTTMAELQLEINKCLVLCYNCHIKYHKEQRDLHKFGDLSSELLEEGSYSLWSQDDVGDTGLYD